MYLRKEMILKVLNAVQESPYFLKGRNNRMSAATEYNTTPSSKLAVLNDFLFSVDILNNNHLNLKKSF